MQFATSIKSLIIGLAVLSCGCTQTTTSSSSTNNPPWFDRTIYLATGDTTGNNNTLQQNNIIAAINNLTKSTNLGEGYFQFKKTDISNFNTSLRNTNNSSQLASFILVLPDNEFANYITQSPVNNNAPDSNAIAIINSLNKRYFFIVIKASCANLNSSGACGSADNQFGIQAFESLLYRQMGLLTGLNIDCSSPSNIMCATPDLQGGQWNDQFSPASLLRFSASFNNALNLIQNTPGFYPN